MDGAKPTIFASEGDIHVRIPVQGRGAERDASRRILVKHAAIAAYIGEDTAARMSDRQRESFVSNNLGRVLRRAVEISQSKAIIPDLPIDAPRGAGLPDIIVIDAGEL